MARRATKNTLSTADKFRLGRLLREHREEMDGYTYVKAAERMSDLMGMPLTAGNVGNVARAMGADWLGRRQGHAVVSGDLVRRMESLEARLYRLESELGVTPEGE